LAEAGAGVIAAANSKATVMPKARFLSIEGLLNAIGRSQRVNRIEADLRARTLQRLLVLALFELVLRKMLL
jgi:hypothetical protein